MIDAPKAPQRGRHTVARHGALKSPHPLGQLAKILAICLSVVLVSGIGVAAYLAYDLTATFTADAVELEGQEAPPPNIGEIEGGVNLFLAGTDACEPEYAQYFGKRCTGPDAGGELNDVNMLVHISDAPRRVTVISFPRDLMMPIPSCTNEEGNTTSAMSKQPLNSTFSVGGLSCAAKAISDLSGQDIQYAASVTWGGVIEITNAIGGVDVCLAHGIRDPYTGLNLTAGTHNIAGLDALQFLRTRHGVGDGSDLGRISNQQQYMSRLARKLVSEEVLTNPTLLLKLARTAIENIDPSTSLTNPLTLVQIALALKNVPFDEIVFIQYPTLTDSANPNHVVPNEDAADQLWAALAANQPLQLTGKAGVNDGVVVAEPTAPPVEPTTPPATEATPGATTAPTEQPIALPSEISGSTAAQETCSNGNLR
ncbi:MAG TPA: LCP family protein [Microbacterium sp.]|uniref:LCP family protein n=1 Tax=Microbacterium sp. TaxID=51671 RepID=UPI002C2F953C|nr:LCP family protein [Microbacterium sp.]HWI29853.1 LCP family protein [Microbacterium sp.]